MNFQLPELPYAYDALEPIIDARTMEIHHSKHHQAYVDNLNTAIAGTDAESLSLEQICASISQFNPAVRNNAWGHRNHTFFWTLLSPAWSSTMSTSLENVLTDAFWSVDAFKEQFVQAAISRFGSGRAWLVKTSDGKLVITSTPNQDNPLMDIAEVRGTPILGLDVREHAYYLNYQNRRAEYAQKFWEILNWEVVENNCL
jgi:superoxide dismutase, Fe-Mn family